jgi:hypothetical protein
VIATSNLRPSVPFWTFWAFALSVLAILVALGK